MRRHLYFESGPDMPTKRIGGLVLGTHRFHVVGIVVDQMVPTGSCRRERRDFRHRHIDATRNRHRDLPHVQLALPVRGGDVEGLHVTIVDSTLHPQPLDEPQLPITTHQNGSRLGVLVLRVTDMGTNVPADRLGPWNESGGDRERRRQSGDENEATLTSTNSLHCKTSCKARELLEINERFRADILNSQTRNEEFRSSKLIEIPGIGGLNTEAAEFRTHVSCPRVHKFYTSPEC